jgi:hypothetical protein
LVLLIGSLGALLTLRGWQKRNVRSARPGWLQKVGSRPWRYRPAPVIHGAGLDSSEADTH